nr:hypothetical protein [uncultured Fluviicola sp.]
MKGIRVTSNIQIVFYILFIGINLLEVIWNGYIYLFLSYAQASTNLQFYVSAMGIEAKIHDLMNASAYFVLFLFIIFCNRYIKRNYLGNGYRFWTVLLSFIPVVNYVLGFIIWRKLNRILLDHTGRSYKKYDRLIIVIWILNVLAFIISAVSFLVIFYSKSPEAVSTMMYYSRYTSFFYAVYMLFASFIYLFYFIGFKREMNNITNVRDRIMENQLLDN